MTVLVGYASKYGATQGIAERIAATLVADGHDAQALPLASVESTADYDAFVIGSAAYMGSWRKDATRFVRKHSSTLATSPVWLFSSGPLGTATTDAHGRDVLTEAAPKQFAEFKESITPRAMQVFFGALDPAKLRRRDRLIRKMPAGHELLPEGDFRDWAAIQAWAERIADELARSTKGGA